MKRLLLFIAAIAIAGKVSAQTCNCETEFTYIKNFMEQNYAGFKDKQAQMTKPKYDKLVAQYRAFTKLPNAPEKCLLIINQFLAKFKDHHVAIRMNFDAAKLDSAYMAQREIIPVSDEKIAELRKSTGFEGIYDFHDAAKYKIAVMKDKTELHDYIAVIVSSNLPGWKKGMIKWEGKMVSDSLAAGALYMLNGKPKPETFYFGKDAIWGDWHRENTKPARSSGKWEPVASRKLSDKTLYLKISSFEAYNAKNIDSVVKANAEALKTTPNLVLDLRDNGGGSDYTYGPLMQYVYTNPVKQTGASLLSTDANIKGWAAKLDDEERSEENKNSLRATVKLLEANKGKWVVNSPDGVINNFTKLPYPQKIVILVNKNVASSTEQFLLFARQSSKVTLMGENTSGTLDYSNWVEAPFSCMPYILRYSTSRSRRLDKGEGIDATGIKPDKYLKPGENWIQKAQEALER
ncbi:S41 family peptidase [Mucilaginibacter pedocola]|uniref:Tail specific protease domain-containing protein n=1 Tax=Mucilaginibacter pedocola TaxID=1792845 RepID=A0A1S9PBN0_9SPHI|nr:S41 family peptidase [Mucilaginibacter pedocola]OOQ58207.1 hypothetical protein BC343_11220 [Mucilaginibacter pedocola]